MKTKSYLIGLLCIAASAGLFTIAKAPAQDNPHRSKPAFVELLYQAVYVNGEWHPSQVYSVTAFGDDMPNPKGLNVAEADVLLRMAGFEPEAPAIYGQRVYRRR